MPRHIYTEDHDAFRASVRTFIERTVRPMNVRTDARNASWSSV